MAYTSNIPQSSDDPSQSQPLLLANFQEIATAFNLNHGDFNDANQGKHEFLQMPEQGAAPSTAAGEGALYTKDTAGQPELYWRDESNGTEWQLTNQAVQSTTGYLTLPGGLKLQWFIASVTSSGQSFGWPTPFSSSVYNVQLSNNSTSPTPILASTRTTASVTIYASAVPASVNVFAIGL